jgi:catechol 2,3-dioxygenase-like lactoylglutathione lyase family enzyme
MPTTSRFDHVGITVRDLDAVTDFFVGLGLEVEGRTLLEGEFLDTVVGIPHSRTEMVVLRPPGGGTGLELTRFLAPAPEAGTPEPSPTQLGLRNVTFEVDDLTPLLDRLTAAGHRLVGGVAEHAGGWRMASVRGPEGFLVNLAQRIG